MSVYAHLVTMGSCTAALHTHGPIKKAERLVENPLSACHFDTGHIEADMAQRKSLHPWLPDDCSTTLFKQVVTEAM